MRNLVLFFLLNFSFQFLFIPATEAATSEIREVSPNEAEDRDFIRNLFKDKRYVFAEEETAEYLKNYPDGAFRAEVIFIKAQIDTVNRKYKQALNNYYLLIEQYPDSHYVEDSLYRGGVLLVQRGQEKKGLDYLGLLLRKFPNSKYRSTARFYLGQWSFKQTDWQVAKNHFQKVLKTGDLPKTQQLLSRNFIAWINHFQGNKTLAEKQFRKLLRSDLENNLKTKICFQLAIDAKQEKSYRKAIEWFDLQLQKWSHPDFDNQARFWLAESIFLLHQDSPSKVNKTEKLRAIKLYSQNLALKNPIATVNSHYRRGWLYYDLGQFAKMEADFQWLQANHLKYARDIDLTLMRADFFEQDKQWTKANIIYNSTLVFHTDPDNRSRLLQRIIRNEYRLKDCNFVLNWKKREKLSTGLPDTDEMHYYFGKCHVTQKEWPEANLEFSKISLSSEFGALFFEDYVTAFRETADMAGGIVFLNNVSKYSHIASKKKILEFMTEFHLALKQWPQALETMNQQMVVAPEKKRDPWFLLSVAQTYDQVVISFKNEQWRMFHPKQETISFHQEQALMYYQSAYYQFPENETENRLSVLDILITRFENKNDFYRTVDLYQEAVELVSNKSRKSTLQLKIAMIYLNQLKQISEAQKWLFELHLNDSQDINFRASTLLAETYIDQRDISQAVKILLETSNQPLENTEWYSIVHFRLGELYQYLEKWQNAIQHYNLVAKTNSNISLQKQALVRLAKIKKYLTPSKTVEKE